MYNIFFFKVILKVFKICYGNLYVYIVVVKRLYFLKNNDLLF